MKVQKIMTREPASCERETEVPKIARTMAEKDCGVVPVLDDGGRPVGVVTDRDITLRSVAREQDPRTQHATDVMTDELVTVRPDHSVEDVRDLMRDTKVRRLLVTDEDGRLVGIISQADLARHASPEETGEVVREISEPSEVASAATRA